MVFKLTWSGKNSTIHAWSCMSNKHCRLPNINHWKLCNIYNYYWIYRHELPSDSKLTILFVEHFSADVLVQESTKVGTSIDLVCVCTLCSHLLFPISFNPIKPRYFSCVVYQIRSSAGPVMVFEKKQERLLDGLKKQLLVYARLIFTNA